jgi:hypothetical protein
MLLFCTPDRDAVPYRAIRPHAPYPDEYLAMMSDIKAGTYLAVRRDTDSPEPLDEGVYYPQGKREDEEQEGYSIVAICLDQPVPYHCMETGT